MFPPGKKARTFDLDAIFEQTRRTAIERSQHILGRFITMISCWSFCQQGMCYCTENVASLEEQQKAGQMGEEGESSASGKSSVNTHGDKAAAASSR